MERNKVLWDKVYGGKKWKNVKGKVDKKEENNPCQNSHAFFLCSIIVICPPIPLLNSLSLSLFSLYLVFFFFFFTFHLQRQRLINLSFTPFISKVQLLFNILIFPFNQCQKNLYFQPILK